MQFYETSSQLRHMVELILKLQMAARLEMSLSNWIYHLVVNVRSMSKLKKIWTDVYRKEMYYVSSEQVLVGAFPNQADFPPKVALYYAQ